jgi:hypothetical protein
MTLQVSSAIRPRVSREEYDSVAALNISRLKEMARSPLHYQYRLAHPKQTATLTLGNAAHRAVLEPARFSEYAVWRRRATNGNLAPRNGQYWEAFKADHPGREIITEDEEAEALEVQAAVRSNASAMKYLAAGEPEVSMLWTIDDRICKGRVDWITVIERTHIVGLKTARDCREYPFGKQAANLGYHLQWAYYHDGHVRITGEEPRMIEIVVETGDGPHDVVVYEIPNEIIVQGRDEYRELLKRLDECERADHWPGTAETEQLLTFPAWAFSEQVSDANGLELGDWS